ncbi:porin [Pedobacter sp. P351]|uniref:porin n=1 Tax=Pedobacter superstes TaxID=3133441 RepID=UPI0030B73116
MFKTVLSLIALAGVSFANAQDTTSTPLSISGSVDTYYKYDFAKVANIGTSFATDQNSVSLGMIDVALKKTTGKASFVGEVSFGPRGQYQSIPNGDGADGNSFHIQNLYATYAFTDQFSMTAGYMGTFVGYEVISPVGNYNYSTSYLFTNGPFQNAGIKANYALSSKVGVMVGLFNNTWNSYKAHPKLGVNTFGAQISLSPVEGWSAYLNLLTGDQSGTIVDLTTAYQITPMFKLGLNAADFSVGEDLGGYTGVALYPQVSITNGFGLGLRGEYFMSKDDVAGPTYSGVVPSESVVSLTLSGSLKAGGLTFIPEIRLDNGSVSQFMKENGSPTKSATQFSLAAVYAF